MADVIVRPITPKAGGQLGLYQVGVNVQDSYKIDNPDGRTIVVVDSHGLASPMVMRIATPGTVGPTNLPIGEEDVTLAATDGRLHVLSDFSPGIYGKTLSISFAATSAGVRLGAIRP